MADTGQKSVLARKADAARLRGPRKASQLDFGTMPQKSYTQAIKRAGVPFKALEPEPSNETVAWDQTLAELTESLPAGGLLIVLEGEERARGLLHMQQPLLDALIEVQTTGQVDTVEGNNRPATQIDAALSRDFIDMLLSSLDTEMEDMGIGNIVMRMHFGTVITDRKQLPLLVPERGFHVFQANVSVAQDAKNGSLLLALPGTQTAAASWPKRGPDPVWRAAFHRTLSQARLQFGTVLFRRQISLKSALALKPGSVIPFDAEVMGMVRVEDNLGRAVVKGRLGQASGNRALRLTIGTLEGSEEIVEASPGGNFGDTSLAGEGNDLPVTGDPGPLGVDDGLPPLGAGDDLPPLGGDGGLPPLGDAGGLPPLGGDGGLPPLGDDGGLPPLGGDGGLPPLGDDGGLPPLGGDGGLPPLGDDGGLPPLGEGGLPPLGS